MPPASHPLLAAMVVVASIGWTAQVTAQVLPMQTQPPMQRNSIREPNLRPSPSGDQTIQQLDNLLIQQQQQANPQGVLQNLNQLERQQQQGR